MRKQLWIIPLFVLLMAGIASADYTDLCTSVTGSNTEIFTSMLFNEEQNFTVGDGDQNLGAISAIVANGSNWTMSNCQNQTLVNNTITTFFWPDLIAGNITVRNASNTDVILLLGGGNYTFNNTNGTMYWNVTDSGWLNINVSSCYNKSIIVGVTDLVTATTTPAYATVGAGAGWGIPYGLEVNVPELNNSDWTVTLGYTNRTCTTRDACRTTQTVIFSGLALLSLLAVIGAGYLIVNLISGGGAVSTVASLTFTVAMIGFAVVLYVGYIIVGQVGVSVCG